MARMAKRVLLAAVAVAAAAACARADMVPRQIPGLYRLIPLAAQSQCPENVRFMQAEPKLVASGTLYIVPHQFTEVLLGDGIVQPCENGTASGTVVGVSSTVLRKSSQIALDRSFDVIKMFALLKEAFFIGYEVGARTCGGYSVPDKTISMWMAPSAGREITADIDGFRVTFVSGVKYVYYFLGARSCLYKGAAADAGQVQAVFVPPSPTPPPLPTPFAPEAVDQSEQSKPICFPASARVTLRDGSRMALSHTKPGTVVQTHTDPPAFAPILFFTHRTPTAVASFTTLTTAETAVTLSATHLLPTHPSNTLHAAAQLPPNATLLTTHGAQRLLAATTTTARGLYNPHTRSGTIVIDGTLCACYTSTVPWRLAHAALLPARLLLPVRALRAMTPPRATRALWTHRAHAAGFARAIAHALSP